MFGRDRLALGFSGACHGLLAAIAVMAIGGCLAVSWPARAQESEPIQASDVFKIARGGQLYDKWWAVTEHDEPTDTHHTYPAAGKQQGATTWRCVECHGWDYKGVDGIYGSGEHYTGIKGVRNVVGIDPDKLHAILMNQTHGYTEAQMTHSAMQKLAVFLSLGQLDMDQYIDRATKKVRGSVESGARFFQTVCAICHGFDGKMMNFGSAEEPEYLGTIANDNPWELLHKIRNGQPGMPMPALGALTPQDQVDILAYVQTLPAK
jgi:thiosulfate dehydrogenase